MADIKFFAIAYNVPRVPEVGDQREPIWAERSAAGYSLLYEGGALLRIPSQQYTDVLLRFPEQFSKIKRILRNLITLLRQNSQ